MVESDEVERVVLAEIVVTCEATLRRRFSGTGVEEPETDFRSGSRSGGLVGGLSLPRIESDGSKMVLAFWKWDM